MEILFHRYGSICEPDIIDAFTSLGITVLEEDSEIQNKHIPRDVNASMISGSQILPYL